jgi:hypothetical protein
MLEKIEYLRGFPKSEIRISKLETNSNDQNTNDQNKSTPLIPGCLGFLTLSFCYYFGFRISCFEFTNCLLHGAPTGQKCRAGINLPKVDSRNQSGRFTIWHAACCIKAVKRGNRKMRSPNSGSRSARWCESG